MEMEIEVSDELKEICRRIINENLTEADWAAQESDDMFQSSNFEGGFDATESAFCFSFFDNKRQEYWFKITLSEVTQIHKGKKTTIRVRPAE